MTVRVLPFDAVFSDESGGNIKTPQSEYSEHGRFPVVDQGKALIAGYVDDEARVCGSGRPAIVFGDHTRAVKYVDFPFCLGADGVKVLRPKIEADLKYLYYFLRQVSLPNAGYDRHFKYLKRITVTLPPLTEQRRIAAILDQADALRAKRREALAQLDRLTQAIFIDMFGDPIQNSKGWTLKPLPEAADFQEGPGILAKDFREAGVPLIRLAGIGGGHVSLRGCNFVDPEMFARKWSHFALCEGDILVLTSATFGNPAVVGKEAAGAICYTGIIRFRPRLNDIDTTYLRHFLGSTWFMSQATALASGAVIKHFGPTHLKQMTVPLPPLDLQAQFADRAKGVERLRVSIEQALAETEVLFASLQHRAFRGEL